MSNLNRQYNIVPGLPAPASDNLFRAIEAGMIKLDAFFATATLDGLGAALSDDEWLAWVSGVGDECVQELLELGYKAVPPLKGAGSSSSRRRLMTSSGASLWTASSKSRGIRIETTTAALASGRCLARVMKPGLRSMK